VLHRALSARAGGIFVAAMLGALWAYDGWNNVAPLAGDRPHRRIALVWRRSSGRKETFRRLAGLLRDAATPSAASLA